MERQEAVDRIILACDGFEDKEELLWALRVLKGRIGSAKLGAEMLLDCGRELIDVVRDETGMEVMADPKLADIPETNAKAVAKLLKSKPKLITIKIDTGSESIRRCVELCGAAGAELVGIAVLTSIKEECKVIYGDEVGPKIEQLSELFVRAGGGVLVSSPQETTALLAKYPNLRGVLNPGIRLPENGDDDQKRVGTAQGALEAGAKRIIVGRPILQRWMKELKRDRSELGVNLLQSQADAIIESAMLAEAA